MAKSYLTAVLLGAWVAFLPLASEASAPPTPGDVVLTPGNAQVVVTWAASAGAASYLVKRCGVQNGYYSTIGTIPATDPLTYTDSGLTNGQTYWYEVEAADAKGDDSAPSTAQSAMPDFILNPPTQFTAIPGNGQVQMTWVAAPNANFYLIGRSLSETGVFTLINNQQPITGTSFADTGLVNGTTYYYEIQSLTTQGVVSVESPVISSDPTLPITPPTQIVATPGDQQIVLTWAAGNYALSYNVNRAVASGGPYTLVAQGVTALTYTDTGLTNNETYYYVLDSVNGGNESANSAEVNAMPVSDLNPPTKLAASPGDTTVTLTWALPSSGPTPQAYSVKRSTDSTGPWTCITCASGNVAGFTYTDTGLTNKETYYYIVTSIDPGSESLPTAPVSAEPVTSLQPPTGLAASPGDTVVNLSWIAPTKGSTPTSYNVKRSVNGKSGWLLVGQPTGVKFQDTGLTNKETYYYEVTSVNAGGESVPSKVVSTTPVTSLKPPTNLIAVPSYSMVSLSWTPPKTGATPTSYNVDRSLAATGPWTNVGSPTSPSYIDSTVVNATTYYYQVTSVNAGGESAPSSPPVSVTPGTAPVGVISTGGYHNCAVLKNGTVQCWGDQYLGNGTDAQSSMPVTVTGVTTAVSVAAGDEFSCVLLTSGQVQCWGSNQFGELGNNGGPTTLVPETVPGLGGVTQLSAQGDYICALLSNGTIDCWGTCMSNGHTIGYLVVPTPVSGIANAVGVSVGYTGGCALLSNHQVECWTGSPGSYGNIPPALVSGISTATAISGGGGTTACAVLSSGQIQCWGNNSDGQLGNNSTNSSLTPVWVSNINSAVSVSVGEGNQTCAVLASGETECWGYNIFGLLGNGNENQSQVPVQVSGLSSGVIAVSGGALHTCALMASGSVQCWGDDNWGQLSDSNGIDTLTPSPLTGITGVEEISTKAGYSCALLSNQTVECWGVNYAGQNYQPAVISGISGVVQVSAGADHTCVVLATGEIQCWGDETFGELGNGVVGTGSIIGTMTPVAVSGINNAVSVSVGGWHTCAVLANHEVMCWGSNQYGQVGNPDFNSWTTGLPWQVPGITTAVSVSAGVDQSCAVLSSGQVQCWGDNYSGELGTNTGLNDGEYTSVPVTVSGITNATAVSAGGDIFLGGAHTCALLATGHIECWGDNSYGELGNNSLTQSTTPVPVSGITGASAVVAGAIHSCALVSGAAECWGGNSFGELGNNTATQSSIPVSVQNLTGASSPSAGAELSCAVTANGGVECWGQLQGDSLVPVQISGLSLF